MKKSINGYFKFYNKNGQSCRIKCQEEIKGQVLIKFKPHDEGAWLYYAPKREFRNCLEVANFILKNLESNGTVFKILAFKKNIK
jgi:hypothetical protein